MAEAQVVEAFREQAVRALEAVDMDKDAARKLIGELRDLALQHFHQLDRKFAPGHR